MANNLTRGAIHRHTTAPISALGLHPVARELLLISRPAEGRRLSWPEHTVTTLVDPEVTSQQLCTPLHYTYLFRSQPLKFA